mmetsp:Transcript_53149/g.152277  ORF Transcript_53149/g.152277 Transcript_53149/m.152277 type:complete len:237 (-) Transcript_53149:262-972(-)
MSTSPAPQYEATPPPPLPPTAGTGPGTPKSSRGKGPPRSVVPNNTRQGLPTPGPAPKPPIGVRVRVLQRRPLRAKTASLATSSLTPSRPALCNKSRTTSATPMQGIQEPSLSRPKTTHRPSYCQQGSGISGASWETRGGRCGYWGGNCSSSRTPLSAPRLTVARRRSGCTATCASGESAAKPSSTSRWSRSCPNVGLRRIRFIWGVKEVPPCMDPAATHSSWLASAKASESRFRGK